MVSYFHLLRLRLRQRRCRLCIDSRSKTLKSHRSTPDSRSKALESHLLHTDSRSKALKSHHSTPDSRSKTLKIHSKCEYIPNSEPVIMVKSGMNELYKEDGQNQADISNFIMRLTGVKYLYLSNDAIRAAYPNHLSSTLKYVKTLEVTVDDSRILPGILERASLLEKLVISSYDHKSPRNRAPITWPVTEPSCLARLKRIEFRIFSNTAEEMRLIEYLLKHGRMLEKMVFCGVRSLNSSARAIKKKIKRFARCSKYPFVFKF